MPRKAIDNEKQAETSNVKRAKTEASFSDFVDVVVLAVNVIDDSSGIH
jgi:hypothetical protein